MAFVRSRAMACTKSTGMSEDMRTIYGRRSQKRSPSRRSLARCCHTDMACAGKAHAAMHSSWYCTLPGSVPSTGCWLEDVPTSVRGGGGGGGRGRGAR